MATTKRTTATVSKTKAATPKAAAPKATTPKAAKPKTTTPKTATPKVATPKAATPKAAKPKAATPAVPKQAKLTLDEAKTRKPVAAKKSVSPEERYQMIAAAAYFRAERHGFTSGRSLDDWIAAEKEIDQLLKS